MNKNSNNNNTTAQRLTHTNQHAMTHNHSPPKHTMTFNRSCLVHEFGFVVLSSANREEAPLRKQYTHVNHNSITAHSTFRDFGQNIIKIYL